MRNRGAYLTKERMPSDSKQTPLAAWKAVPDWRCTALQAVVGIGAISPAHPRFTRMYGVTNSTVFQTVLNKPFFTTAGSYFVPVFCLSVVAPAGWGLIFLGNPQGLPEKRRTRISRDLPQAKPIKGRHKESILISLTLSPCE